MKLHCLIMALALVPAALPAAERNDVQSCYSAAKIEVFRPAPSGRLLTVVVDQTTPLSEDLQKTAWSHIRRFIQPGDKLRLYSFSAYLEGRHTRLQFSGSLEKPLTEDVIGNVPMMANRKLESCLKRQPAVMFNRFGQVFAQAMGKSSSDIPRSEILFSLKEISEDMRKTADVSEHVMLVMSDMLEHSDFGSFYARNSIRDINPSTEIARVESQNLIADFGGARVYVHGAAFVPIDSKNGYRSGKMIQSLKAFWSNYFQKSNAELIGFGTPELTAVLE